MPQDPSASTLPNNNDKTNQAYMLDRKGLREAERICKIVDSNVLKKIEQKKLKKIEQEKPQHDREDKTANYLAEEVMNAFIKLILNPNFKTSIPENDKGSILQKYRFIINPQSLMFTDIQGRLQGRGMRKSTPNSESERLLLKAYLTSIIPRSSEKSDLKIFDHEYVKCTRQHFDTWANEYQIDPDSYKKLCNNFALCSLPALACIIRNVVPPKDNDLDETQIKLSADESIRLWNQIFENELVRKNTSLHWSRHLLLGAAVSLLAASIVVATLVTGGLLPIVIAGLLGACTLIIASLNVRKSLQLRSENSPSAPHRDESFITDQRFNEEKLKPQTPDSSNSASLIKASQSLVADQEALQPPIPKLSSPGLFSDHPTTLFSETPPIAQVAPAPLTT